MKLARHHAIAAVIGLALFASGSLYSYPRICCMFGSNRYFGWPYPYLNLHKEVETYAEADLVRTLSVPELLGRGWRFDLGFDVEAPGLAGSAVLNLVADLALALAVGTFAAFGLRRLIADKSPVK